MSERAIPSIHGVDHVPGGPDPIPPYGTAIYAIEVLPPDIPLFVDDTLFEFEIPEDLDQAVLLKCEGYVNVASGSGTVEVQLRHVTVGDMLLDPISIEVGDLNSKDSGTQPTVNPARELVEWGDHIAIDIDGAGSALGLGVVLYFVPLDTKALIVEGSKGDPGGVDAWRGPYDSGDTYVVNEAVSNGGSSYVATVDNPTTEPGVDPGWEAEWMLLAEVEKTAGITFTFDGNGYPLDTGIPRYWPVPYDCTITDMTLVADRFGSLVIDIWKDTFANHPPTDADSITSSSPPTLSSAIKGSDTTLAGWTTSLAVGDVLAFNVDSCSLITFAALELRVEKV